MTVSTMWSIQVDGRALTERVKEMSRLFTGVLTGNGAMFEWRYDRGVLSLVGYSSVGCLVLPMEATPVLQEPPLVGTLHETIRNLPHIKNQVTISGGTDSLVIKEGATNVYPVPLVQVSAPMRIPEVEELCTVEVAEFAEAMRIASEWTAKPGEHISVAASSTYIHVHAENDTDVTLTFAGVSNSGFGFRTIQATAPSSNLVERDEVVAVSRVGAGLLQSARLFEPTAKLVRAGDMIGLQWASGAMALMGTTQSGDYSRICERVDPIRDPRPGYAIRVDRKTVLAAVTNVTTFTGDTRGRFQFNQDTLRIEGQARVGQPTSNQVTGRCIDADPSGVPAVGLPLKTFEQIVKQIPEPVIDIHGVHEDDAIKMIRIYPVRPDLALPDGEETILETGIPVRAHFCGCTTIR